VPDRPRIPRRKPTTVIGLGNELLSDDGAGIRVLREVKKRLNDGHDIAFEELSLGGLELLDYVIGYERCIIVDAVVTGAHPAGTLLRFLQTGDSAPVAISSSHQIDLAQVLALATLLGANIPDTVTVYGIEAQDVSTFHEGCTSEITRAIPRLVDAICTDLTVTGTDLPPGIWQIIHDPVPD
jgi:hydrogenase maturation protease